MSGRSAIGAQDQPFQMDSMADSDGEEHSLFANLVSSTGRIPVGFHGNGIRCNVKWDNGEKEMNN